MTALHCRHALLIFYLKAGVVLEGATTFNNSQGDGDLDNLLNWSMGLPTLLNPGTISGTLSTTYGGTGQVLNSADLTLALDAQMSDGNSGNETRITDSIIRITGNSEWQANARVWLGRGNGSESSTEIFIQDNARWIINGENDLRIGRRQIANVNQSGGTVNVGNNVVIGANSGGAGSSYNLSGGTLITLQDVQVRRSSNLNISETDPINAPTSANITRNLNLRDDGSQITISGGQVNVGQNIVISSDNLNITQNGGTVSVTNNIQLNNGIGREYRLQGGRLEVANRIVVNDDNIFVWETGGVLAVSSGQNFIDYRGSLNAGNGAVLDLDSNTQYLDVGGTLNINGLTIDGYDLMLALQQEGEGGNTVTGSYLLIETNSFNSAQIDNITPIFSDSIGDLIDRDDTYNDQTDTVYWINDDGNNNIRLYYSIAPIPEPSSSLLVAVGVTMLALRRRRQHRAYYHQE